MTDCTLCGQPIPSLGNAWTDSKTVVLHHDGQYTQQVACKEDEDGCTPILSTCYRAWHTYGLRPYDWEEPA